jgi:pyruvate,orthophosphate dikinase
MSKMTTSARTPATLVSGKTSKLTKPVSKAAPGPDPKMRIKPGKMVYYFGASQTEGTAEMKVLLGGKGANLADMTMIGLPVPPGFTITTDTCALYYKNGQRLPHGLMNEVHKNISFLEKETGKKFGDNILPLLVSVRSGAAVSMPGMMDTILNLGLTDQSVAGLANSTKNARFAYDAYRRLINMFGDVVMGVDHHHFEESFNKIKKKYNAKLDTDVPEEGMIELCEIYKTVYQRYVGEVFPQNPYKQLELAIEAVFKSWNGDRAVSYRRIQGIQGLNGTAVNIQAMAYGNMGEDSGTGVAFTRNPATGENIFYGEFLVNAQGEDVVAGIRTPQPVDQMPKWNKEVHKQLLEIKLKLEKHYKDMQDIEFTIEKGKLYMLQTRNGKRNGVSAVRIACDMVREKLIDEETALLRIPAGDLTQLLLPSFDPAAKKKAEVLTRGIPASPGAAVGKLAFTAGEAVERALKGEAVLLLRRETSPEDVEGMHKAVGILTSTGGRTSHAAVVACGWGKCCVVGAGELEIDTAKGKLTINGKTFGRNDVISIDGSTGEVIAGPIATVEPKLSGDFSQVMKWSDKYRKIGVRTNADTPNDAQRAREFGAEGIGLCRTEHMFFEGDRIKAMREMILADNKEDRIQALNKLLPYQQEDFLGIFKAMKGMPVTIRLIDPPLHEFLPHDDKSQKEMAQQMGVSADKVRNRVQALHEANPMLGHRGCRLCITYPEILEMQVTAIILATIDALRSNYKPMPEIMIPLVGTARELSLLRTKVEDTIASVKAAQDYKPRLDVKIGTMIEVPRAAVTADSIAEKADFFSFGTNDLTQMTFGFSRDDIGTFLPDYLTKEVLPADPFQTLDQTGVGALIEMAVAKGRGVKPDLKIGICGEHGGDAKSVWFCHGVGMDYVSCSPFRVPIARLAAAQAAIMDKKSK